MSIHFRIRLHLQHQLWYVGLRRDFDIRVAAIEGWQGGTVARDHSWAAAHPLRLKWCRSKRKALVGHHRGLGYLSSARAATPSIFLKQLQNILVRMSSCQEGNDIPALCSPTSSCMLLQEETKPPLLAPGVSPLRLQSLSNVFQLSSICFLTHVPIRLSYMALLLHFYSYSHFRYKTDVLTPNSRINSWLLYLVFATICFWLFFLFLPVEQTQKNDANEI